MGLPCHQTAGVGTVESRSLIEEDHLFGLSFGVEVGYDFEGGVALYEGHFHVEGAEVDAEDGFGEGCEGEGGEEEGGKDGWWLHGLISGADSGSLRQSVIG